MDRIACFQAEVQAPLPVRSNRSGHGAWRVRTGVGRRAVPCTITSTRIKPLSRKMLESPIETEVLFWTSPVLSRSFADLFDDVSCAPNTTLCLRLATAPDDLGNHFDVPNVRTSNSLRPISQICSENSPTFGAALTEPGHRRADVKATPFTYRYLSHPHFSCGPCDSLLSPGQSPLPSSVDDGCVTSTQSSRVRVSKTPIRKGYVDLQVS